MEVSRPSSPAPGRGTGCGRRFPEAAGAGGAAGLGPSPFLLPGVGDAADDGAEHERGDEGEEGQVDEALDAVVAEAGQRLHVVLGPERRRPGTGDGRRVRRASWPGPGPREPAPRPGCPPPPPPARSAHQVQAAAVHQRGEVLQVHLRAVQRLLHAEQRVLGHTPRRVSTRSGGEPPGPHPPHPLPRGHPQPCGSARTSGSWASRNCVPRARGRPWGQRRTPGQTTNARRGRPPLCGPFP